jgi:tetratricopeptide (TPR) repeat protein
VPGILPFIRRWLWLWVIAFCATYVTFHAVQRTEWYKARLYRQLLEGQPDDQLRAASLLARLGAERLLLASLSAESATAREYGRRGLEYLWFNAAGEEAYEMTQSAYQASEKKDHPTALSILNQLITRHPQYAEGWNRRAAAYWELGEVAKSMSDSERALALNPNHYGAWQGLGLCHLQEGNLTEACRCLRKALRILPHDEPTRASLRRCEEFQRTFAPRGKRAPVSNLI